MGNFRDNGRGSSGGFGRDRDRGSRGFGAGRRFGGGRDRGFGGRNSGGFGRDRSRFEMHDAICDKCKKECQVPFKPTGDKPVLCSDCFRESGNARDSPRNFGSSISGSRDSISPAQFKELNKKLDRILEILKDVEFEALDEDEEDEDDELSSDDDEDLVENQTLENDSKEESEEKAN